MPLALNLEPLLSNEKFIKDLFFHNYMKTLTDIVGKNYAARGAFTQVQMENMVPNGVLGFKAINNRLQCTVEGIIYNLSQYKEEVSLDYRVQLTKIQSKGHTIDLTDTRKKIKEKVSEQGQYEISITNTDNTIETYSGKIISSVPIIEGITITQKEESEKAIKEGSRDIETEFDVQAIKDALQIGFKNILYDRHKDKILIIRTNMESQYSSQNKKSVIVGRLDGEFVTEELQPGNDESLIKRTYMPHGINSKMPHVRAGHIRHYEQLDGSVILVAVAPYVVRPLELSEFQKEKYHLGIRGEITQETMLETEKRGSLEDKHIEC
jgi:hypothetical protein